MRTTDQSAGLSVTPALQIQTGLGSLAGGPVPSPSRNDK